MGGVVSSNVLIIKLIADHLGISEGDFFIGAASNPRDASVSPYFQGDIAAIMRGEISSERFWINFEERTGLAVSGDPWYDFFNPVLDERMVDVIKSLQSQGKRVVCGTNTMAAHYQRHSARRDYSLFDVVYASHIMGIIKPCPEFWAYILCEEKVLPEEAFFVDDLEENILAAEKMGLKTHLFTGAESLATAVRQTCD